MTLKASGAVHPKGILYGMVVGLGCVFIASCMPMQAQNSNVVPSAADRAANYMAERVSQDHFSGSVLVAKAGHIIFQQGYGLANREWDAANTSKTIFRIASITKQFTAAAILILQQEHELSVQEKASKYLPDLPKAWNAVTLHQLLTHTSGIPNYVDAPRMSELSRSSATREQLLALVQDKPLAFVPGSKWGYSNTNYLLLAMLVEKVSGEPYEEFLATKIFQPLHLGATGYDRPEQIVPERASPYIFKDGRWTNAPQPDLSVLSGAGGLHSNVEDLFTWFGALQDDRILSEASRKAMFSIYPETAVNGEYEGYGVIIAQDGEQPVYITTGNITGFSSAEFDYPKTGVCVIVLSNLDKAPTVAMGSQLAGIVSSR